MTEEEVEMQLNRLFHAAVGDPPGYVSLSAIRRLVVVRRIVMSVTVTVAIALAGCVRLPVSADATGPTPASVSGQAGAPPRYYFEEGTINIKASPGFRQQNVIRATATGAVTGTVRCPWPHSNVGESAVAAPQKVYLTCFRGHRDAAQNFVTTGTRIYKFTLTGAGRPVGYSLVPGGVFPGESVGSLTVAASGSDFAAIVGPGRPGTGSEILVVNARTGARAGWRGDMLPGGVRFGTPELSLTASGRELGAFGRGKCVKKDQGCRSPGEEMLVLSPALKGGQIASGRKIFVQSQVVNPLDGFINDAFLTPDGTAAIAGVGDSACVGIVQVSASTGKTVRVLYRRNTGNGFSYRFLSVDPTGKYLLFDAGPPRGPVNGWINNGTLIRLKPQDDSAGSEAW